jgi:hypothetical protein
VAVHSGEAHNLARLHVRKDKRVQSGRKLTVGLAEGLPVVVVVRDVLNFTDSGDELWNKIRRLARFRAPLDDALLADDLRAEALLLDYSMKLRMAPIDGSLINVGDILWWNVKGRESERE